MKGKLIEGKVISVYDGDTVKALFPLNGVMYKWNCRLIGVDTPEIRTRNKLEKEYGYYVRDELRNKILDNIVMFECSDLDKYGRLLVRIICNYGEEEEYYIDEWLINNGYAFSYDGGTKSCWG